MRVPLVLEEFLVCFTCETNRSLINFDDVKQNVKWLNEKMMIFLIKIKEMVMKCLLIFTGG